jgi:6-phosphogluconolactonase
VKREVGKTTINGRLDLKRFILLAWLAVPAFAAEPVVFVSAFGSGEKAGIHAFGFDTKNGTLKERQTIATLPKDFTGKSHTADLKITPDGKHLYGTNRGHDSLAAYRIAEDGTLTLLAIQPSGGKGPQNLLITPDGRWLLCANMPGNNVVVFQIDAASGSITPNGEPVEVPMASCIRWMEK